jgi:Protein of unknown function (DUF2490)
MKKLLVTVFFLNLSFATFAQRQTVYQVHGWYMYFGNHALTDKWSLHTEYQFRRSDLVSNWQQSLTRIGVDYKLNSQLTLTAGYAFIRTYPYGEQPISEEFDEHRIWQTLTVQQPFKKFSFNHRYRLEQRWLERFSSDPIQDAMYLNRIRYRFMVTIPLINTEKIPSTLFLSAYDEVFIGFGKNVAKNIMDQNRLYFALGYKFSPAGNIQLGFMNQTVVKRDGILQEQNRTLMVAVTYNLDFRKPSATGQTK